MKTKYVVMRWATKITAYECTKETAQFVWLKGLCAANVIDKRKKDGDVFDTWAEAHAELTRRAEVGLAAARRQLALAQGFAGNVRGMKPPQEVQRWPETFSRRQRAEEATRLCTEAGIDLKSPGARRLVRDAEDGMPLHDVLDLIKHWNTTATTSHPTENNGTD